MSSPAVSSLFLLASPRCLPHFLPVICQAAQLLALSPAAQDPLDFSSPAKELLHRATAKVAHICQAVSLFYTSSSLLPLHALLPPLISTSLCVLAVFNQPLCADVALSPSFSLRFYYLLLCLSAGAVDEFKLTEVKDCVMLPFGNKKTPFVSFILHMLLKIHMLKGLFSLNFYTNDQ